MSIGFLLAESQEAWRLIPTGSVSESESRSIAVRSAHQVAQDVRDAINEAGGNSRVVLAPDSNSCYFCKLNREAIAGLKDRKAMLFEMESSLPLDAESVVADIVPRDKCTTGIAIDRLRWLDLVRSLDDAGVLVESIVPLPVLAAQSLITEQKANEEDLLVWSRDLRTDLIVIGDRQFNAWRHFGYESDRLSLEVSAFRAGGISNEQIRWINLPKDYPCDLVSNEDVEAAAARAAARILQKKAEPWYELRRDDLAAGDPLRAFRGPLRFAALAASLLVLTTIAASLWRRHRIDSEIQSVRNEQRELFKKSFPGTRVPAAMLSRIRSEHRKALGARKVGVDVPKMENAIDVLDAFLAGSPKNLRLHVDRIEIRSGELRLDVQLRAHADAGKLAASLEGSGFEMRPPGTQQRDPKTVVTELQGVFLGLRPESSKPGGES